MGIYKATNYATSTLAGGITAIATTLTVQTGHGDRYPEITGTDFTYLFLEDSLLNEEIVKVTARAAGSDSMTIVRGQLGTSARSWLSGDLIECRPEASQIQETINHVTATAGAHNASAIANTPAGNVAATNVQDAIDELDGEKLGKATGGTVSGDVDFTGNVTFDGGAGSAGQVLVSQGAGATPSWGNSQAPMATSTTGTGAMLVTNNETGHLQMIDLAASGNLVKYRVSNIAGTEYEVGSGAIVYTNTGCRTWAEAHGEVAAAGMTASAYGASLRVKAADSGKLLTSADDISWTVRDAGFGSSAIKACIYAGAQFMAGGAAGKLSTSADGITWAIQASAATAFGAGTIYALAHNGSNLYVAAGTNGKLATSPDGITWTSRTSGFGTDTIRGLAYGNGYWVAVGAAGKLFVSTDGTTWNSRTSGFGASTIYGVAYGLVSATPTMVAVGDGGTLTYSTDGTFTTWSAGTSGFGATPILAAVFASSLFVIVGGATKLSTSSDGATWTLRANAYSLGGIDLGHVSHGNSKFFASGTTGENEMFSTDGTTWTANGPMFENFNSSAAFYGLSLFHAFGASGKLASSADGSVWTQRTSGFSSSAIHSMTVNGTRMVAVGVAGKTAYSDNGTTWTSPGDLTGATTTMYGVASNGTTAVAVGAGGAIFSTTTPGTVPWTSRTSGVATDLSEVCYGAKYVAVGVGGVIVSSADGATWAVKTSGVATDLHGVAYGAGLYVAVGASGVILSSPDAVTWTARTDPSSGGTYRQIIYANMFIAACSSGRIVTSPDGITWTIVATQTSTADAYGVAASSTEAITLLNGGLLYSADLGVHALSLTRTTPYYSSNTNAAVNFSAGTKGVSMVPVA